jgi:hypothetical protein
MNALVITVNLVLAPAYPWFLIPLVIWGIGLLAHFLVAFPWMRSENEQWMAQVEYRAEQIHQESEIPVGRAA